MNILKSLLPFGMVIVCMISGGDVDEHEDMQSHIQREHMLLGKKDDKSNDVKGTHPPQGAVQEHKRKQAERKKARIKRDHERKKRASRGKTKKGRLLGTFVATAYDDSPESQGKWVGKTSTGVKPQVGVIAVDPKVIPYYSKLRVEDMNGNVIYQGKALDCGGAIKGKRLDLFKNTRKECYDFGRRKVKVYIVE